MALQKFENHRDAISNLPNDILCNILGLLNAKHAVATSVLSSKWRNLFPSIEKYATLDFDDCFFLHPKSASKVSSVRRKTNFSCFVSKVLNDLHHLKHLHEFRLHCDLDYGDSNITDWIFYALNRNVTCLCINVCLRNAKLLFDRLSGCKALRFLELSKCRVVNVVSSFYLPNLEGLTLTDIQFIYSNSIVYLLEGCPILKSLRILRSDLRHVPSLCISNHILNSLTIEQCKFLASQNIVLDTPLLEHLMYENECVANFQYMKLESLKKAHLSVAFDKRDVMDNLVAASCNVDNLVGLVVACYNVDTLYLSQIALSGLCSFHSRFPSFCNLTSLKLGKFCFNEWLLFQGLLDKAPNLENLILFQEVGDGEVYVGTSGWSLLTLPPNLKKFEVHGFTGGEDEIELVEHVLSNAEQLDEVNINSVLSLEEESCILETLLLAPRLSKACEIRFLGKPDHVRSSSLEVEDLSSTSGLDERNNVSTTRSPEYNLERTIVDSSNFQSFENIDTDEVDGGVDEIDEGMESLRLKKKKGKKSAKKQNKGKTAALEKVVPQKGESSRRNQKKLTKK